MPIDLIDTIKPKNNGTFPMVEAEDVVVGKGTADEKRLPEALAEAGKVAAVDTAMPEAPADDHVPSTQLLKEQLAGYLNLLTGGTVSGEVLLSGGIRANQIRSLRSGTLYYDIVDEKGARFSNVYQIFGYGGGTGSGNLVFEQTTPTSNQIDVTTLKEGGTPIADKYAAKAEVYTKAEVDGKLDDRPTMKVYDGTGLSIKLDDSTVLSLKQTSGDELSIDVGTPAGPGQVTVPTKTYVDGLVGDINAALAAI